MNLELPFTTVVSGLPRSGTSLMMQMLKAGGMPILSDGIRRADEDNPNGYFEWEPIKQLATNSNCIDSSMGQAVKIVHLLLPELPGDQQYRVILMRRNIIEVLKSQQTMLERNGKSSPNVSQAVLAEAFMKQLERVQLWMSKTTNVKCLEVEYADILQHSKETARRVQVFLDCNLDQNAMCQVVDPGLYRNRASSA